ncbi:MAG TPA: peptidylprolyl isomerase [Polyangiaceae bacterium]|nr:peptidylprolyl isomerase [Polyangiaceae bacterium]
MPRVLAVLLREPLLHFFALGAVLFALHRALAGDARTIVVTPGVRADLKRRFNDQNGRAPSSAELARALRDWERDEALYREALSEGLDRDDATVRTVLADKVRARAAQQAPKRSPSQAELEAWLERHRALYEAPTRYEYELVTFAETPNGARDLEQYEKALAGGQDARVLGRPIVGGTLGMDELRGKFGGRFAEELAAPPLGRWRRFESPTTRLLVRLVRVEGGLASVAELRERLVADWSRAREQEAVDQAVERLVARYRIEERP